MFNKFCENVFWSITNYKIFAWIYTTFNRAKRILTINLQQWFFCIIFIDSVFNWLAKGDKDTIIVEFDLFPVPETLQQALYLQHYVKITCLHKVWILVKTFLKWQSDFECIANNLCHINSSKCCVIKLG